MPAPPPAERLALLLADLVEAAGGAHTEVTLVRALFTAIARHLPLLRLEIARIDAEPVDPRQTLRSAAFAIGMSAPSREARPLPGTLAAAAIASATTRVVTLARAPADERRAPELDAARAVDAAHLLAIPLRDDAHVLGCAILALGDAGARDPGRVGVALLDAPALLDATARVLAAAVRQVDVLGRVAALSRRAHTENRELRGALDRAVLPADVVAASGPMRALFHEIIPLVARQDTTVLLRGETGTGKEVVARRIHRLSPRAARPFLRINCGALPEGLVESALFGHARGAFTGATARHAGFFERAHGGTLLLLEVAELPLHAQAKLLRVLQEGELERVGGEATVRVDVRVIAATHRPLEAMLDAGELRADLYYRLQVFPIVIPPLRERPEDIDALAAAIVARLATRFGRPAPRLDPPSLRRLRAHVWPGNVRELENVIERAMVLSTGDLLALPDGFDRGPGVIAMDARTIATSTPAPVLRYRDAERRCIEDALRAAGGRIHGAGGAAELLGLKPTTLQSKMKRLGITRRAR